MPTKSILGPRGRAAITLPHVGKRQASTLSDSEEVYLRIVKSGVHGGYANLGLELGSDEPVDPATLASIAAVASQNPTPPPGTGPHVDPTLLPPFMFVSAGGEPNSVTGTFLSGATVVITLSVAPFTTASMTPTLSDSGQINFTWPALPANGSAYNLKVVTAFGTSNTLTNYALVS